MRDADVNTAGDIVISTGRGGRLVVEVPDIAARKCAWLVITVCLGVIALGILSKFSVLHVWDDAYIFVRYADNVLTYAGASWDPGGEVTYGLTSPLFLSIVLPIRILTPNNPAFTALLSSLLSGILFLGLLIALIGRYTYGGPTGRGVLALSLLFSLATSA